MNKFQKWWWCVRLGWTLIKFGYPNGRRRVVSNFRFAFRPCWTEMRDDGYTPVQAWDEEVSCWEG